MLNIGNLSSSVFLNTKAFDKGVSDVKKGYKKMEDSAKHMSSASSGFMAKMGKTITKYAKVGAVALLGLGTAFVALEKKALDFADKIGKVSDVAGITTDTLQQLRYAAGLAGVSTDELDNSMMKFGKTVGELKAGTGALYTYLNKVDKGFMAQLMAAKNNKEAFDLLIRKISSYKSQADRAALASAAFGRTGIKMTNMLKNGSDAMYDLMQKAEDFGLIIDEKLIRNAEGANDAISTMAQILKIDMYKALLELAPYITEVANQFANWVKENKELIAQNIEITIGRIADGIKTISDCLIKIHKIGGFLGAMWGENRNINGKGIPKDFKEYINSMKNTMYGNSCDLSNAPQPHKTRITVNPGNIIPTPRTPGSSPLDQYMGMGSGGLDQSGMEVNNMISAARSRELQELSQEAQEFAASIKDGADAYTTLFSKKPDPGFLDTLGGINEITTQIADTMSNVLVNAMDSMNFSLKGMAEAFAKALKIVAASLTARHLMQALSSTAMALYYMAIKDAKGAAESWAAAKVNAMAAATFGSFVVGAGLAGMAHDGISSIPQDGTWLLQKNERVLDSNTNNDLKDYLKQGGGTQIVQNIEINGGDQESVRKALPELKKQIIDVVNNNISTNGSIRRTIRATI